MSLDEVKTHFEEKLQKAQASIAALRRGEGLSFLGVDTVLAVKPFDSPKSKASFRKLNPRFATKDADLMTTAKVSYRAFCDSYETARQRWLIETRVAY